MLVLSLRLPKKTCGKKQSRPPWVVKTSRGSRNADVTRQTVGKWVSKFRKEGEESLKAKRKGRPEGSKLLFLGKRLK
jgi:hypothetical protein